MMFDGRVPFCVRPVPLRQSIGLSAVSPFMLTFR